MTLEKVWNKPLHHVEGYHEITVASYQDCDHGPCTAYEIQALGLTVFVYERDPSRLSFHFEPITVN